VARRARRVARRARRSRRRGRRVLRLFPGSLRRPVSGPEQAETILGTATGLGMGCSIVRPAGPWAGERGREAVGGVPCGDGRRDPGEDWLLVLTRTRSCRRASRIVILTELAAAEATTSRRSSCGSGTSRSRSPVSRGRSGTARRGISMPGDCSGRTRRSGSRGRTTSTSSVIRRSRGSCGGTSGSTRSSRRACRSAGRAPAGVPRRGSPPGAGGVLRRPRPCSASRTRIGGASTTDVTVTPT
jgi:hypothetical protein